MELTAVACNHCGASLDVPESARFVTCRYCNSQLEIKRTDSTITTEVLQRIDQATTVMAQDLQALRRDAEIERLDREWERTQASLMVRDKDGNMSVPTAAGGIGGALVMGIVGVIWTIVALSILWPASEPSTPNFPGLPAGAFPPHESPGPPTIVRVIFPLFGVVVVIGAIVMGIKTTSAAQTYEEEKQRYLERRQALLGRDGARAANPEERMPQ